MHLPSAPKKKKPRAYPPGAECVVENCDRRPELHWMCRPHRYRYVRYGDATFPDQRTGNPTWPYCKRGHNKEVVGHDSRGACKKCKRLHARAQRERERREREESGLFQGPMPTLRLVRERFGLNRRQFAAECGLSYDCIEQLERGVNKAARPTTKKKVIAAVARLEKKKRHHEEVERYHLEVELQKKVRGW